MPRDVPASPMTLRPGGLKTSLFCSLEKYGFVPNKETVNSIMSKYACTDAKLKDLI